MTAFQLTQKLEAMEPALDGALALLSALTQELTVLKARVSANETAITAESHARRALAGIQAPKGAA